MKRSLAILGVLVVLGIAGFLGVRAWRQEVLARQEQRAFVKAEALLKSGEPFQALVLQQTQARPNSSLDWAGVQLRALVGLRDVGRLSQIYEREPSRVLTNEQASLLVARGYSHSRRPSDAEKVRKAWRNREVDKASWLVFDSDALILTGKPKDAEKLLRSQTLPGKDDAVRLTRLAILVAKTNLSSAWQMLGQAVELDPQDADIRLFRGQLMEGVGRMEAARFEYASAVICRTNDAFVRDELAEFYRRRGNYPLAIQTWTEAMPTNAPDYFWLKAGFWSKMVSPTKLEASAITPGSLKLIAQWLVGLPPEQFFETNTFTRSPDFERLRGQRQELYWLHLAELLRHGQEAAAMEALGFNKFRPNSWEPDLEVALLRILHYRSKANPQKVPSKSLKVSVAGLTPVGGTNQHQFFTDLAQAAAAEATGSKKAVSPELDAVLLGPDAFTAAFLAAGWREAALLLHRGVQSTVAHPMWLSYGLAEAIRSNRSAKAALEFLESQPHAPELELLAGEILIQLGRGDDGLARLRPIASTPSAVGQRSSYILALASLDRRQFDQAREWIRHQPLLTGNDMGQELLGRAELGEGHDIEADAIYKAIVRTSVEAKAHLARRAYDRKDWAEARRLTTELLTLLPDSLELRSNLLAIDKAAAKQ